MKRRALTLLLALTACAAPVPHRELVAREPHPVMSWAAPRPSSAVASRSHMRAPLHRGPRGPLSARALWFLRTKCESGGNYRDATGNGFWGAYQFAWSTWRRIWALMKQPKVGAVRPDRATPQQQDAAASYNYQVSGERQWPGCSNKYPGWWRK